MNIAAAVIFHPDSSQTACASSFLKASTRSTQRDCTCRDGSISNFVLHLHVCTLKLSITNPAHHTVDFHHTNVCHDFAHLNACPACPLWRWNVMRTPVILVAHDLMFVLCAFTSARSSWPTDIFVLFISCVNPFCLSVPYILSLSLDGVIRMARRDRG